MGVKDPAGVPVASLVTSALSRSAFATLSRENYNRPAWDSPSQCGCPGS